MWKSLVVVALASGVAVADPEGDRSPVEATLLSAGATIVSAAAIYGGVERSNDLLLDAGMIGLFLGPSLGHLYGERRIGKGLIVRAVGAGTVVLGAGVLLATNPVFCLDGPCSHDDAGFYVMGAGLGVMVGGAILDIALAYSDTVRANAARRIYITPTRNGIALGGRF